MKAAIYRRYGPPDVVRIVDLPIPDIKTTQMLVKVRATTVTAGDSRLRSGRVPRGFGLLLRLGFGILGPRKPILGWELAGEVAAVDARGVWCVQASDRRHLRIRAHRGCLPLCRHRTQK